MAYDKDGLNAHTNDLLSCSPLEELNSSPVFNHLTSLRHMTSESSERSDNSSSDVEENIPREIELCEQYGRTPPSCRTISKPCKERTKSSRKKKGKSECKVTLSSLASWKRRQSASATSSARAFNRSLKEEESTTSILTNGFDEQDIPVFKPRNRSFTESTLTRKGSQRKFMCIRYKESINANVVHFKQDKSAICPLERVKFYDTMNMLINLGQGGGSEGRDKNEDENENFEVEELREALWLELQAWRNSMTMLDQDEWLMNERKKINNVLEEVIYFHVDKTQRVDFDVQFSDWETDDEDTGDEDDDGCCLLHPSYSFVERSQSVDSNELVYYNDSNVSTSSEISEPTFSADDDEANLSDFAQAVKKAVVQVSSTLNKLYSVEQLYPSLGALKKDFVKYDSDEFHNSHDTLVLWLNQIKGLYHKLHVMSRIVHVDFEDEKVWKDWIDLGLGLKCLKSYNNNCQNCQELDSKLGFDMPENFEYKRGLSLENTSTSRYRLFVDQNIKKMGVASLGYKLHQLIHMEMARASIILQVDRSTSMFKKHQRLHKVYKSMLVKKVENFCMTCMDPENDEFYSNTFGVPPENWIERFQAMGLPSFDSLYVFLVRLVMDVYHECLRMRMEHRPKGDPSSLSVRQLLEECREVLLAAVVVRQYFLDAMEGLGKDLSSCPLVEEHVLEFDQDIQNMLEVYFEYLHLYMHMLQRLPEASCGVRNILEEEWDFVKEITPYIRGGEVQAGKRFCVMARGLVESTADFLTTGMDDYFFGLHDCSDNNEKLWVKVLQSCRDFKKLFKETRERSVKALGFVRRLRSDLGVAATFHVNVTFSELLEKLRSTRYIQVVTKLSISVLMFVRHSLKNSKSCITELLNACCGLHSQSSACAKGIDSYIVLVSDKQGACSQWTGEKIDVTPALDASLGLVDIQVDELAIVACTSCALSVHVNTFQSHVENTVSVTSGATSCHHDLIDMKAQISESVVNLRTKICDALDGAAENLDVEKMYDIDENERNRLSRSTLEALQCAFNSVFDFHREMKRIPETDEVTLSTVGKYYLELATKWMQFVLKRCEKGKGSRPRWAAQGLKFLMEACHPTISCHLSNVEFEKLQLQISECVDHVIGSADNGSNSPGTGNPSWSSNTKFSRSSTFPGTYSHVHPSRTISEPGRPSFKRAATIGSEQDEDQVINEMETLQRRISRVRKCVAGLEYKRQERLLDKGVIGRVSNKKRDLAGELAVIPKRVPFKWQRGNKIGEGQFGKVYACVNLDTEEVVAMKQITFHPNDHSAFQDLADEIKAFEGLTHNSLVKYYGCEVHRDVMYIFMEYCGDGTISDVSKLGLPEAMIRKYADQILIAVEFLHDRGIVHRDIKGPNIFLSSEGLIKLGDFGASVKLVNPSQTMCGEVATLRGTIAYMAPEVITLDTGAGYGRAADIWSVGCVVVEMATGKAPWSEYDNQWAIMLKVGEGGSPSIPEGLSEEGRDFLCHCFVHDPHERWTARQLQNHTFLKCC